MFEWIVGLIEVVPALTVERALETDALLSFGLMGARARQIERATARLGEGERRDSTTDLGGGRKVYRIKTTGGLIDALSGVGPLVPGPVGRSVPGL